MTDVPNGDMHGQSNPPDNNFEFIAITKNARISSIEKIVQVLAELEHIPWDIILFSETRATSGTKVLDGGHVLYSSIDPNNAYAGVAILLHTKHVKKNIRVHRTSGRVIGIDFKMHGRNYCAISTYVPHCGYSREDFDETYNQLRCLVSKAHRSCKRIIIGGDFNTQFGVGIRGVELEQFS